MKLCIMNCRRKNDRDIKQCPIERSAGHARAFLVRIWITPFPPKERRQDRLFAGAFCCCASSSSFTIFSRASIKSCTV